MHARSRRSAEDETRIELKSRREIGLMRQAGLAVWQAHQIVTEMIAPGVSTAEIDAAVEAHFDNLGATPLFKNYPHPDADKKKHLPPFPAVTCMSVNEAVVHGIPTETPLKEGDIVSVDTGCRLNGWCGDAARTYAVGQISPETQRLLDVTLGSLELAFELMHNASRWSQVAREMATYVGDHGYSTVECFVGHGIGREMHEDPQVPNFVSRRLRGTDDFRLDIGLVLAVEPMVNMGTKEVKLLRDQWTQVTADGKLSAHFEHTIAITKDGPVRLTEAPTPAEQELLAV
ncbi:MAG: type I methionyl aminopeptidase [Planctomycetota bacterium]